MQNGGSLTGTLTSMRSRTFEAIWPAMTTADVYLPGRILAGPGRPPKFTFLYPPAAAQITLNLFNNQDQAVGVIYAVRSVDENGKTYDSEYFTNSVYALAMERVSVAVFGEKGEGGFGTPWCMALLNVFQFSSDSGIEQTDPIPPVQPGRGDF